MPAYVRLLLAALSLLLCFPLSLVGQPHALLPHPAEVALTPADTFFVTPDTRIVVDTGDDAAARIGLMLAELIGNTRATTPRITTHADDATSAIILTRQAADSTLGPEGYTLDISPTRVTIRATDAAGLFYGTQTLRQLLPAYVEYTAAFPQPLFVPTGRIVDRPRFAWRGSMLDVARHFLSVADVQRYLDLMALHKLNRLHLHLSDDQGWRIEIPGWPNLTAYGGSTEVGGGPGGFYTMDDYRAIVDYAAERYITIVPEIDVPGHTNAALASYAELNCDRVAPPLYTGIEVGFSSLCVEDERTYAFLDDVFRTLAAMTPGPYLHIGGDEVKTLTPEQYAAFIARVQTIVRAHGKEVVGWDEIALTPLEPGTIVQLWRPMWRGDDAERSPEAEAFAASLLRNVEGGAHVILSPADRTYLDMKYDSTTVPGLAWAGYVDVRRAYDWTVDGLFGALPQDAILGIEAPLWTETVSTIAEAEYMAFPRLAGIAELAWAPASVHGWDAYRTRLSAQTPRWTALGINFRR